MSSAVAVQRTVLPGDATLTTLRGGQPGPTLALLGGVHGDEDEGVLAVHRVLHALADAPLTGTVRAVAPANPPAWAAYRRSTPLDDQNLARCFPGDHSGGPTATLAAGITEQVITGADLLIDLHSAGVRYEMPLFCGFTRDTPTAARSERAARAFGAPLIWVHPRSAPGRSLTAAADLGVPAIYAECSGGGRIRRHELDAYVQGVLAVLADLGMLPSSYGACPGDEPCRVYDGGDLDAGAQSQHAGLFVSATRAGATLAAGDEIGTIYDTGGQLREVVRAPQPGMVMFLRREARIRPGDVLFALAALTEPAQ